MLIGIGTDILVIERLRRSLVRFGRGYLEDIFSDDELARASVPADEGGAAYYARAFCAKEACAKALGTGLDENVDWFDFSVDQSTLPASITLSGGALSQLTALTPQGLHARVALDVGSKRGLAHATVVIFA